MPHHNPPHIDGREPAVEDQLLIPVKEAARRLSLSPWSVYELCASGRLQSGKHGKRRLVSAESVRDYAQAVLAGEAC